jgi:DNA-binding transcriptional ArsR family regulator
VTLAFHALADPRRRDIVELLLVEGEQPVTQLVERLPIAQSGVSRHLRILKEAGFVQARGVGKQRLYQLRPEPFEELDVWLRGYRRLWEDRFARLEDELRRKAAPRPTTQEKP